MEVSNSSAAMEVSTKDSVYLTPGTRSDAALFCRAEDDEGNKAEDVVQGNKGQATIDIG
jgi:hypothetical protein